MYFKAQSLSQSSKIQLNSDSELGIKGKKKWTKEEILQNKENTICQRHDSDSLVVAVTEIEMSNRNFWEVEGGPGEWHPHWEVVARKPSEFYKEWVWEMVIS